MKPLRLELSNAQLAHLAKALVEPAPAPNARLIEAKNQAKAFFNGFQKLTAEEVEANRRKAYNYAF